MNLEAGVKSPSMKSTVKEFLEILFASAHVETPDEFANLSEEHRKLYEKILARSVVGRPGTEVPPDIDAATELSREEYQEYLEEFTYLERLRRAV